jgi:NADH-quinone oxidoreductase subunit L
LYTLLQAGALSVEIGLYADGFAMALLLLVSGVSSVVHVFSSRYMQGDPRYARFFAAIALFTSAMLLLVLSANLMMLYMCWEVMGLCSYLLISHWAERRSACHAATRAFLVNAVADVGLGCGVILTWATFNTLDIQTVLSRAPEIAPQTVNVLSLVGLECSIPVLFVITSLLFVGAMGKSAQFPLHVWLPFAMEAPTPVSALIHAATMVNAGVYLLVRLAPLLVLSPGGMVLVALTGGLTALFAGIIGLTQCDIKRILAYSTISQLGFMILACGVGAFRAATFHLISHGALKAYLFLSSGSAVTAVVSTRSHQSVTPKPGSWNDAWPLYSGSFLLAMLPSVLLFSAPFSALWTSTGRPAAAGLYSLLAFAASFFAAYLLSRLILETFQKPIPFVWKQALPASLAHPRPFSASLILGFIPFVVGLAVFLAVLWTAFTYILFPAGEQGLPTSDNLVRSAFDLEHLITPLLVASAGWGLALTVHGRRWLKPSWITSAQDRLYVFFMNRGYVDEVYEVFVVQPTLRAARWVWSSFDLGLIDGLYRAMATFSLAFSRWLWQVIDVRGIDRGVVAIGTSSLTLARWLWQEIDVRRIDRVMTHIGASSITTARWLWKVDVRGVERVAEEVGRQSDATGRRLARIEPRTLQHHVMVMIAWLVFGLVIFYWFAP